MVYQLNLLAIGIATIATFIVGFLWYTPLFGKVWAKENGFEITGSPPPGSLAKGMIMNLIGNFFLAYVFASNNEAWMFAPEMDTMSPVAIILMSSFFTWLGFFLPVDLNTVAWERKSWKLFFINTGYHFVSLLVASTIITLMG